jgi:hypothetical protein
MPVQVRKLKLIKSTAKPPPILDCARVLQYAVVDRSMGFSGRTALFVGGIELGRVPRLAIAEEVSSGGVLVFHCKQSWRVLGCSTHALMADAKKRAEGIYPGLSSHWVKSGVTKKEAKRFLHRLFGSQRCNGCGKRPDQVRRLISKRKLLVCDCCVRELHKMLGKNEKNLSGFQKA